MEEFAECGLEPRLTAHVLPMAAGELGNPLALLASVVLCVVTVAAWMGVSWVACVRAM